MNTIRHDQFAAIHAVSRKATGPKTPEGKAVSKMNAVKHGLLSREVVVNGECPDEFNALHESLQEELQPVGTIEAMLVDQIVTAHWRLRRVMAAESGEINREVAAQQGKTKDNALPSALEETAAGCQLLQTWLSDTVLAVERDGELTHESVFHFGCRIGTLSSTTKRELNVFYLRQKHFPNRDNPDESAARGQQKQKAVAFLQENLRQLGEREVECRKKEEAVTEAEHILGALPGTDALNKFMRYESMLNRQLFRAMKELRTLQEKRGEMGNPNAEPSKAERKPKSENRSANLPNEPIPAPQASEISNLKSQMDEELRNEANEQSPNADVPNFERKPRAESRMDESSEANANLPNEPVEEASEIADLTSQMEQKLLNEANA